MNIIYINEKLLPSDQALLSVDERGFRFGDGVFETIALHGGVPYLLHYHLERLQAGLQAIHIPAPVSLDEILREVIAANKAKDGIIRIYVSRGIGSQGYLPTATTPTIVVQWLQPAVKADAAVKLWLSSVEKISPRALPTHAKLAQGLNATLARMQAREQGCHDALQLDAKGHISEASSANIFWVKQGKLFTPALTTGALAGVTRRRIMELAGDVSEAEATPEALQQAEEVFLTNASTGITAVATLLPLNYTWNGSNITGQLIEKREADIRAQTAKS